MWIISALSVGTCFMHLTSCWAFCTFGLIFNTWYLRYQHGCWLTCCNVIYLLKNCLIILSWNCRILLYVWCKTARNRELTVAIVSVVDFWLIIEILWLFKTCNTFVLDLFFYAIRELHRPCHLTPPVVINCSVQINCWTLMHLLWA
jgi:hypothetical protein